MRITAGWLFSKKGRRQMPPAFLAVENKGSACFFGRSLQDDITTTTNLSTRRYGSHNLQHPPAFRRDPSNWKSVRTGRIRTVARGKERRWRRQRKHISAVPRTLGIGCAKVDASLAEKMRPSTLEVETANARIPQQQPPPLQPQSQLSFGCSFDSPPSTEGRVHELPAHVAAAERVCDDVGPDRTPNLLSSAQSSSDLPNSSPTTLIRKALSCSLPQCPAKRQCVLATLAVPAF